MSRRWYFWCVLIALLGACLFVLFPLEFIEFGWFDGVVLTPYTWAVQLVELHWVHSDRYKCNSVSLAGYISSFSVVVPITLDGSPENIVAQIDQDRVAFVRASDVIRDACIKYANEAAQLNEELIAKCGLSNFK